MMQLEDPTRVPPGGILHYIDPETGKRFSHPYLRAVLDLARAHRKANNLPVSSHWAFEVEDNICKNTPAAPCVHRDTGIRRAFAIAKHFTRSMTNWARSGFKLASEEVIAARRAVCENDCPFWEDNGTSGWGFGRCGKCGCSGSLKTGIASEKCPLGKWPV